MTEAANYVRGGPSVVRGLQDEAHCPLVGGTGRRIARAGCPSYARGRRGEVLTILGRAPSPARGLAEGLNHN